jgi:hypothetical protein
MAPAAQLMGYESRRPADPTCTFGPSLVFRPQSGGPVSSGDENPLETSWLARLLASPEPPFPAQGANGSRWIRGWHARHESLIGLLRRPTSEDERRPLPSRSTDRSSIQRLVQDTRPPRRSFTAAFHDRPDQLQLGHLAGPPSGRCTTATLSATIATEHDAHCRE